MTRAEQLRALIKEYQARHQLTYDQAVIDIAGMLRRSRSMVYKWLSSQPDIPENTLNLLVLLLEP